MKIFYKAIFVSIASIFASCAYDNAEELYGKNECNPDDPEFSFSLSIAPIISANCAVSGCHVSGQQLPTLETYEQISSNAAKIKSRTSNGTMPPPSSGYQLDQVEIDQIACWVDGGAQDN